MFLFAGRIDAGIARFPMQNSSSWRFRNGQQPLYRLSRPSQGRFRLLFRRLDFLQQLLLADVPIGDIRLSEDVVDDFFFENRAGISFKSSGFLR